MGPETPLLQAELFQLPKPLFIGDILQSLEDLAGPLLGSSQYVHVSLILCYFTVKEKLSKIFNRTNGMLRLILNRCLCLTS